MRITWAIEGRGSGSATTETADGAAEALTAAVREAYTDLDTQTLSHIMLNAVAPLRAALVTDGRYEAERGRVWELNTRGIFVTLYPN